MRWLGNWQQLATTQICWPISERPDALRLEGPAAADGRFSEHVNAESLVNVLKSERAGRLSGVFELVFHKNGGALKSSRDGETRNCYNIGYWSEDVSNMRTSVDIPVVAKKPNQDELRRSVPSLGTSIKIQIEYTVSNEIYATCQNCCIGITRKMGPSQLG